MHLSQTGEEHRSLLSQGDEVGMLFFGINWILDPLIPPVGGSENSAIGPKVFEKLPAHYGLDPGVDRVGSLAFGPERRPSPFDLVDAQDAFDGANDFSCSPVGTLRAVRQSSHETGGGSSCFSCSRALHGISLHPAINLRAVKITMGFEQLAELRDRLRAEKEPPKADSARHPKRKSSPQAKSRIQDPALEAIRPLQKHFPLAFPVNPAPKVPLKEGILKDAEQHLGLLGLTLEQLKLGISAWCRGARYWACMVEDAPRLDLSGQPAGVVTSTQAVYAKQQASRQRGQDRRHRAKSKEGAQASAASTAVEQNTN